MTESSVQDVLQLRQTIVELQAAIQARDEFISMIGHEMRNPMTPLLMQISALREAVHSSTTLTDRIVRSVELLEMTVEHFMRRAAVLLDVSRMSSGIYKLEPAHVDAAQILRSVIARMTVQANAAGCPIHAHIDDHAKGHWDPLALEQITDNLLSNAIKYGDGKPVKVLLSKDSQRLSMSIEDRGIGISKQDQGRIFDRFERAITRGRVSGFGVGLWLVGRLVHEMRGEIHVTSTIGAGTTFTVHLPLHAPEQP